jgi:hypothetical protein
MLRLLITNEKIEGALFDLSEGRTTFTIILSDLADVLNLPADSVAIGLEAYNRTSSDHRKYRTSEAKDNGTIEVARYEWP